MKIFARILILVIASVVFSCSSSSDQKRGPEYSGDNISLRIKGEWKLEIQQEEGIEALYLFSDDTGWCEGLRFEVENGNISIDFSKIKGVEPGVIRFKLGYERSEGDFLDLGKLTDKDKDMFVRKTSPSSEYHAGEPVFALLFFNDWFSPVPTEQKDYGRDQVDWAVKSRNIDRSDCLIDPPEEADEDEDEVGEPDPPNDHDPKENGEEEEEEIFISASIDAEEQILYLDNIYTGFETPEGLTGEIMAVSDKTGWSYLDGVSVVVSDGQAQIDLAKLMYETGPTRFNLIMDINGEDHWLISSRLSEEAEEKLLRVSVSGDTVLALEDVTSPIEGEEVGEPDPPNDHDPKENGEEEEIFISASIDAEEQILYLDNIYTGFETPEGLTGEIMAVSDKTGWSYLDGVSVVVSDGQAQIDLAKLMYETGPTRFNLIMDINGEDYWFISSRLSEEAEEKLLRVSVSGDTVLALEDVVNPVEGEEVGER